MKTNTQETQVFNYEKECNAMYDKYGAFFAFNDKQFEEQKKDGVIYIGSSFGLLVPKSNIKNYKEAIANLKQRNIENILKTKGKRQIIWDSLVNHECQISIDYIDAYDNVKSFGITEEEVKKVYGEFMQYCVENDLF